MTEPLFLKPYFNPKIWGGRKLKTEYGFDIPDGKIGEAWIISGHPHGPATIENGPLKGKTLRQAWHEDPAYFGPQHSQEFPLLVKILDAEASFRCTQTMHMQPRTKPRANLVKLNAGIF